MSLFRVACTWVELVDGRALTYAHQTDYDGAQEAWAAFHAERQKWHPGAALQVDLVDLTSNRLAESWSREATPRSESPMVTLAQIQALNKRLRGVGRRLDDHILERDEEEQ